MSFIDLRIFQKENGYLYININHIVSIELYSKNNQVLLDVGLSDGSVRSLEFDLFCNAGPVMREILSKIEGLKQ